MTGMLSLDQLREDVAAGSVDTVLACQIDMQGRLMGKRFQAEFFCDSAWEETHSCNYLQATDMEMYTVPGYKATSWEAGYGDYTMKPDLDTLRRVPWLEGTALVLCDLLDHATHADVPHSPRAVLKKQVARLEAMNSRAFMASELEFFLFGDSYAEAHDKGYRGLRPISPYNEDYHIFQTTKEEDVMRAIRNGIHGAGIPVENSKGEADAGQEELNVQYADALTMADRHTIMKNGIKEIAWAKGRAVTFMAKWDYGFAGNSCHIHQSLAGADDGQSMFHDADVEHGMSEDHAPLSGGPAASRQRDHLFPGALYQLLQALHGRHFRTDQGDLEPGQPHRGIPPVRCRHQGRQGRMPGRRGGPQSLSRLCGAPGGGPRRHREQARTRGALYGRCLWRQAPARDPDEPCGMRRRRSTGRRCCGRRSATR